MFYDCRLQQMEINLGFKAHSVIPIKTKCLSAITLIYFCDYFVMKLIYIYQEL